MATEPRRLTSRSVLLWSCGGIGFLVLVALICWLVLGPFFQVRAALKNHGPTEETISGLGGPRQAARKLSLYLRVPERWAGDKRRAVYLLGSLGPEAAGATGVLAELLATPGKPGRLSGDENPEAELRGAAATALGRIGPAAFRAVPALEAALLDRDPYVRVEAALALTRIRPEGGLQPLAGLLADPDRSCREDAAYRLGAMGSAAKAALPALEQRLAIDDRAADKFNRYSGSWWSIRYLRSAIRKIRTEPDPMPEANREVRAKLEKRWAFAFAGVPFEEAFQRTADAGGFKVVIAPSLTGPDASGSKGPITLRMSAAPYDLILEWMCKLSECDWTVKDGAVYVFDDKELK